MLAQTKCSRRQNDGVNKIFPSTKCWCRQNIRNDKISAAAKISLFFAKLQQSISLLTASYQKLVKTKSDYHHCPISVHILMTSKSRPPQRSNTQVSECSKVCGWQGGAGGELLAAPPPPALVSRWGELQRGMHPGHYSSTISQLSLSLSPPSSVSQQAGQGSMKKSALDVQNTCCVFCVRYVKKLHTIKNSNGHQYL